MTPLFEIYQASEKDIPLIRELTFQVWPQTYAAILSQAQIDYMLDMMYSPSSLQKQMKEGCCFIIVYENKEPAGFASFQHLGDQAYKLHKIYVLPSQQGKGTGKFLLEHICDTIRSKGAKTLELQVNLQNRAKDFYEKKGFTVTGQVHLDIGNGYFMNDYIMTKEL